MTDLAGFESFRRSLGDIMERDLSTATADARLEEDLELDSVELFEVLIAIEEVAGVVIDDDAVEGVQTLGDLHTLVRRAAAP
ncbi:hypothetical protein BH20ACT2_BH20ACT2_09540 [soil metagenome]